MQNHPKSVLEGERICLRAPEPSDIDFIYSIENDTSTWHLGNTVIPYSKYQIEQYILASDHDLYSEHQLRLMIDISDTSSRIKTIGTIDLFDFDPVHQRAGIGILIVEEERNKGYALEALQIARDYCFGILALHQLFCTVLADNESSLNLFEKAGFTKCGVRRDWRMVDGQWTNEVMFQLINT